MEHKNLRWKLLWIGMLFWASAAWSIPFRYAEDQAPGILNPIFATTMSEARINELVFESLYADDQELRSAPLLAESHEISADGLSMTVYLRPTVAWHDGEAFSAEDVVFTVGVLQNPNSTSTEAHRVDWIESVEAIDRLTVRFVFHEPELRPQDKLTFKILPQHRFNGTAIRRTDAFHTHPVGTGPFEISRFNDDNSISLQRFSGYRNSIGLDEVIMREVSDKTYQARLLHYDSLEAVIRVLPRDLAQLQNSRNIELYPYQTNSWWYLGFNLDRAPFDDLRVRTALALSIDVQALLDPIGTGELLSGPYVRSSPYYNHNVPVRETDTARAGELLEEAGYRLVDGYWTRRGERLGFRITAHRSLESSQEVVINLQSQLRNAGVDVLVDFLDEAVWKDNVWRARDFDIILSRWSFDRNEDVRPQLHSEGGLNFTSYANPRVDELFDEARAATNPHAEKMALRELHRIVADDVPMIFLWTLDSYAAMSSQVRNVMVHPFYFFTWAQQWQIQ